MSKHSTFVDSLFINTIAQMLGHDIVVVHMHEDSVANGLFSWIYGGGSMGNGAPAQTCPLFLTKYLTSITHFQYFLLFSVYFEDGYYQAGHFQSCVPYRDSKILAIIREKGGFNIAEFLEYSLHGEFITVYSSIIFLLLSFNGIFLFHCT